MYQVQCVGVTFSKWDNLSETHFDWVSNFSSPAFTHARVEPQSQQSQRQQETVDQEPSDEEIFTDEEKRGENRKFLNEEISEENWNARERAIRLEPQSQLGANLASDEEYLDDHFAHKRPHQGNNSLQETRKEKEHFDHSGQDSDEEETKKKSDDSHGEDE